MSEDETGVGEVLPFEPSDIDFEDIDTREVNSERAELEDVIEVNVSCPSCQSGMSINTVVSQENREYDGRSRYEAVCTECQMAVIITLMKTVGSYDDLMGFDSPEIDWEMEDL